MRNPTPSDVRRAVILTALVTVVITIALLDPSCSRHETSEQQGPTRSVAPR